MSEGDLISHSSDVTAAPASTTTPVAPAKTEAAKTEAADPVVPAKADSPAEAPKVESPAIQPQIEETTPAVVAAVIEPAADTTAVIESTTDTTALNSIPEIPAPEPKMPSVATLPEPVARLVDSYPNGPTPPDFLREHTTRIIAAKPPLRADPKPPLRPRPVLKPELKAEPKTDGKTGREAPRQTRFALLAATLAICAGLGATLGSAGIAGLGHFIAPAPAGSAAEVQTLREQIAQLAADLSATRTNVEHINRTTVAQFGKIVERFDRAERAQADPTAKLAKISETIDKLEKRIATLPTTTAAAATQANDITGTVSPRPAPETKAPPKPPILEGFVLRRVYDGVALVESRMGVVELVPGTPLPGGGRVEDIKREDGRWVVVTSRGLIVSQR